MNESRTRRIGAGIRTTVVTSVLAGLCVALTSHASGAQKLGTLVSEGGFDWMAGTWVATTSQGDTIEVTYKWEVDKHVVSVTYKASIGFAYRGLIFYRAVEDRIVHVGADNQGGVWEGVWESDGQRAIMKFENTKADGQIQRGAAASSRVDADTMKVEMYPLRDGKLAGEPLATTTYRRKKPARKASN